MDLLDLIIVLICIGFAVSGYRQGFVVGVMSFVGFVGGLLVGVWLVPQVMSHFRSSLVVSTISLCAVLALAVIGQVIATTIGGRVRRELTWRPIQAVDQGAGAVVSVISVLLVTWFLGLALSSSSMPLVVSQVQSSRILAGIQKVLPKDSATWFRSFSTVLGRSGFPQVFGPFTQETIANVPAPDSAVLYVPGLQASPLKFDTTAKAEDDAVVAGFPEDGPFSAVAARIRQEMDAQGQDIYDQNTVTRDIFSLYSTVLQGNSGGPLLTSSGEVYGVVFAKSLQDSTTGYALTASQVSQDAQQGADLTSAVDTDGCAV